MRVKHTEGPLDGSLYATVTKQPSPKTDVTTRDVTIRSSSETVHSSKHSQHSHSDGSSAIVTVHNTPPSERGSIHKQPLHSDVLLTQGEVIRQQRDVAYQQQRSADVTSTPSDVTPVRVHVTNGHPLDYSADSGISSPLTGRLHFIYLLVTVVSLSFRFQCISLLLL